MNRVYAPGCALMLYKAELAEKVLAHLCSVEQGIVSLLTCCRHDPLLGAGSVVINTCAGCDRRFRELYEGVSTVSLWEVLADDDSFEFPDYCGAETTVHDACPTRTEERVHAAARKLLAHECQCRGASRHSRSVSVLR